jgi:transketolase
MKKAFFNTLYELAEFNPNVQFIKGDTAYIPEYQAAFPDQYLDVGIAEQNMIGVAAGMALEGKIPFTYSIVNFATMRCLEQIRNDIAYHNLNVNIVSCGVGFDYGPLGASHHATEDIAIMRAIPNMTIFSPCDPVETIAVTKAAFGLDGPCWIRNGHGNEPVLHAGEIAKFQIGKAYALRPGTDVAIFVTGSIAADVLEAARDLGLQGYDVGVYSFPTIKPIDMDLI